MNYGGNSSCAWTGRESAASSQHDISNALCHYADTGVNFFCPTRILSLEEAHMDWTPLTGRRVASQSVSSCPQALADNSCGVMIGRLSSEIALAALASFWYLLTDRGYRGASSAANDSRLQ